jgi:zinc transport system substrate-binding protein
LFFCWGTDNHYSIYQFLRNLFRKIVKREFILHYSQKEYYKVGYETDIERIVIKDNMMTFYKNGEEKTGEYKYHGYEILTYESGNRGVRYLFDLVGESADVPKHVQFSDHSIYPTEADHYHIYFGNEEHDTLLNELDNWPTYYFSNLSGEEIAEEMNAH